MGTVIELNLFIIYEFQEEGVVTQLDIDTCSL